MTDPPNKYYPDMRYTIPLSAVILGGTYEFHLDGGIVVTGRVVRLAGNRGSFCVANSDGTREVPSGTISRVTKPNVLQKNDRSAQSASGAQAPQAQGEPMAKKKAGKAAAVKDDPEHDPPPKPRQKRISGTYDEVPAELQSLVEQYVTVLRGRKRMQEKEFDLKGQVREKMKAAGLVRIEIDDGEKFVVIEPGEEKVRIKAKKDAANAAAGRNGDGHEADDGDENDE